MFSTPQERRNRGHNTLLVGAPCPAGSWPQSQTLPKSKSNPALKLGNNTSNGSKYCGEERKVAFPFALQLQTSDNRPSSRRGHIDLRMGNSVPIILGENLGHKKFGSMQEKLAKFSSGFNQSQGKGKKFGQESDIGYYHCSPGRIYQHSKLSSNTLPAITNIHHVPKLMSKNMNEANGQVQDLETSFKNSKIRSKQLKRKVLGSSEANLLPNKPVFLKLTSVNGANNSKKKHSKSSKEKKTGKHESSSGKRPPSRSTSRENLCVATQTLFRKAAPAKGQVNIAPKIHQSILREMHGISKSSDEKKEPTTTTTTTTTAIKLYNPRRKQAAAPRSEHFYTESKNPTIREDSPSTGGQMVMASRSFNKFILKPDVPPGMLVPRRKSKFMENQRLQDVYSLSKSNSGLSLSRSSLQSRSVGKGQQYRSGVRASTSPVVSAFHAPTTSQDYFISSHYPYVPQSYQLKSQSPYLRRKRQPRVHFDI